MFILLREGRYIIEPSSIVLTVSGRVIPVIPGIDMNDILPIAVTGIPATWLGIVMSPEALLSTPAIFTSPSFTI